MKARRQATQHTKYLQRGAGEVGDDVAHTVYQNDLALLVCPIISHRHMLTAPCVAAPGARAIRQR